MKLTVFSVIFSLFLVGNQNVELQSTHQAVNDRSIFNYEILSLEMQDEEISIKGWAFLVDTQNYYGKSTHKITVVLKGKNYYKENETINVNYDLSTEMSAAGERWCSDSNYYSKYCNYVYRNVGFSTRIDLKDLPSDEDYEFYLRFEAFQTRLKYETPLYFTQAKSIDSTSKNKRYVLNTNFSDINFVVFEPRLIVTSSPHHSSSGNAMYGGGFCSTTYGNRLYYQLGTHFSEVFDKKYYNNLITYYKVSIELDQCIDNRRRVVSSKDRNLFSYIPATHINYIGKPLTLNIMSHEKPRIIADDIVINQYSEFRPLDFAIAYDKMDGDISNLLKVTSNNVNTHIPSDYTTCYSVTNSSGLEDKKCIKVTVTKLPVRIRYINQDSVSDAKLHIWTFHDFNHTLLQKLSK